MKIPFYFRRLAIAPKLLGGELGFMLVAILLSVGAVESAKPTWRWLPAGAQRVVYVLAVALALGFQYRERWTRIVSERRRFDEALAPMLEAVTRMAPFRADRTARSNVMLLRAHDTLRVEYRSGNMLHSADAELELKIHQGNAGPAMLYGRTRTVSDPSPESFALEDDQYRLTRNLKTLVSIPIMDPREPNVCLGVLNVDSEKVYDVRADEFRAEVLAIEEMAQTLGPILELAGAVWYKKRTEGRLFPTATNTEA